MAARRIGLRLHSTTSDRIASHGQSASNQRGPCGVPESSWPNPRRRAVVSVLDVHTFGSSGFRAGNPTPTTIVAAGTVEVFAERRGEAICPKGGEPRAGGDAAGGVQLAVRRVPRCGRDRLTERGGGDHEPAHPADQADQADGVRLAEPRAPPRRDQLPSRRAGSPREASVGPRDFLKRCNPVVRNVQHGI